jgi:hypothetical protein
MYEPHVTLECTPSRLIAGNAVTRYRYTLSVHTPSQGLTQTGRGMNRNPNSRECMTYELIRTSHAHWVVWGCRTPSGSIIAQTAGELG